MFIYHVPFHSSCLYTDSCSRLLSPNDLSMNSDRRTGKVKKHKLLLERGTRFVYRDFTLSKFDVIAFADSSNVFFTNPASASFLFGFLEPFEVFPGQTDT